MTEHMRIDPMIMVSDDDAEDMVSAGVMSETVDDAIDRIRESFDKAWIAFEAPPSSD